jgi:hypothetical protein
LNSDHFLPLGNDKSKYLPFINKLLKRKTRRKVGRKEGRKRN